ncbi:MAG: RelA/SpoT family protein [Muribaculaceae bacterium]|nr:RelA/SpoT family protein [Muribaculaceae bacterium]
MTLIKEHEDRVAIVQYAGEIARAALDVALPGDIGRLRRHFEAAMTREPVERDDHGLHPVVRGLDTALTICYSVAPDRNMIVATLLSRIVGEEITIDMIRDEWGDDIASLVEGLTRVASLYGKGNIVFTDNFRNLLLTFARDLRVIIIMIVDRLALMTAINHHPDQEFVRGVAREAAMLYAPLAHRLGLYGIKSKLEDMALKYTLRDTYTMIARKLNATKVARDAYIADFIAPVKQRLEKEGLKFDIKGRTKSIASIYNKMKKQGTDLDRIYDLFAIRIILDTPQEREKTDCWTAYSIVTDMYQPNPSRMKDWISVPKSNGYESLHITVMGPAGRWVEVQIRTRRMDLVAERGLAAHWKYKGLKAENNLDAWMNNVRDILEAAKDGEQSDLMRELRMDVYDKEVFVFTPKGDLYRLPLGASLLDFAFAIHSRLGCICTGGKVNGKNERLSYRLRSGDTVEVMTSPQQTPKQDWLSIVVTSKARNKIRQTLNERAGRDVELGKELLSRRFKNRKIDVEEALLMKVIKKLGFKTVTDFYSEIQAERLDPSTVIERYLELSAPQETAERVSAEEFTLQNQDDHEHSPGNDVLVIGDNVRGISYKLSKCCNPIYGDEVFGFVASDGAVKIHRADCPNALHLRQRYPYRVIAVKWSGKLGALLGVSLRIVGRDDIGIVTNITSIINKEKNVALRSIAIDSHDGLFQGQLTVGVPDNATLQSIIKKIKTVKGVKDVERSK